MAGGEPNAMALQVGGFTTRAEAVEALDDALAGTWAETMYCGARQTS